ncbi:hypothetical protein Y032_0128g1442 [Ancylostoma ceylanicum]|nr:hypothetical protein Y032_0128g1442 [Ancylostoma ceylanicum]
MHVFAVFSYFDITFAKAALGCGHMVISFNRVTAFNNPLTYENIWSPTTILSSVLLLWTVAAMTSLPYLLIFNEGIFFLLLNNGIIQLYASNAATTYDGIVSVTINTVVIIFCSTCYILSWRKARNALKKKEVPNLVHRLKRVAVHIDDRPAFAKLTCHMPLYSAAAFSCRPRM